MRGGLSPLSPPQSAAHAALAFESLGAVADEDKSGRPQKKLFLDDEGKKGVARLYCKIRGM